MVSILPYFVVLVLPLVHANSWQKRTTSVTTSVCSVATATPPPRIRCSYQGNFRKPVEPFSNYTSEGFASCRNSCLVRTKCVSFGFDDSNDQCTLYHVSVRHQRPRQSPTNSIFYWNRRCFVANYTTSPIILNPGFESGTFRDWGASSDQPSSGSASTTVKSPGLQSTFAAYVAFDMAEGDYFRQTVTQEFNLCGGVTYAFSASFYLESPAPPDGQAAFNIILSQDAGFEVLFGYLSGLSASQQPVDQWNSVSGTFTAENDALHSVSANIYSVQNGTTLTLRLDDFSLVPVSDS